MIDNEIIKALECCSQEYKCTYCPFEPEYPYCSRILTKNVLEFINRQQTEIERLNSLVDDHFWDFCSIAGCEGASNDCWKTCPDSRYNKIKNEAIREFAEKLKELYTDDSITDDYHCAVGVIKQNIDGIVKEMVGDTE